MPKYWANKYCRLLDFNIEHYFDLNVNYTDVQLQEQPIIRKVSDNDHTEHADVSTLSFKEFFWL